MEKAVASRRQPPSESHYHQAPMHAEASGGAAAVLAEKAEFFGELRRMRENWRIRKVQGQLFGDLGYRICKCQLANVAARCIYE